MMPDTPQKPMEDVIRDDGRYPLAAFAFLHDALTGAVKEIYGDSDAEPGAESGAQDPAPGPQKHVSGKQLCLALRDLALERWGMLARTVLAKWHIHATIDFGNMVYLLIRHSYMRKTDEDSIEDFRGVYDFDEAFRVGDDFEVEQ